MNQNGELKISNDLLFTGSNEAFQFIEGGKFSSAVKKLDELMNINPDYPGLEEGYRTARFWNKRREEFSNMNEGKQIADFLMTQWEEFENYAKNKNLSNSLAYQAAMKYIFYTASEHYKIAFQRHESTTDNFELLLNLGICFLILQEYKSAIETLEYAHSFDKNSAKLLAILGEAYFHAGELQKGILFFKEAFSINPTEIDISSIKAKPILELIEIVNIKKSNCNDIREWISIFAFIEGIFNVRRQLNIEQLETIKRDIYSLEISFQTISKEKIENSNIIPRLINKYLWMLEYFKFQKYDPDTLSEIKERLIQIDQDIFEEYFKTSIFN